MTASPALSAYLLFMQGLSLQGARDRNAAIKTYTELLDYFLDERWISTAALYHIGLAHQQNGDERRAQTTFDTLVEDPGHARHALAARALRRLGDMCWRAKKSAEAAAYWRRVLSEHYQSVARSDYNETRDLYAQSLAVTGQWPEYETLLFEGIPEEASKKRTDAIQGAADWLRNRSLHFWPGWYYEVFFPEREREPRRAEWRKQMAVWYDGHRGVFAAADRQWDHALLGFRIWREYRAEEAAKRVPEINKLLRELKLDDAAKAKAAREFAIVLCENRMFDEARTMLPFLKNVVDNLWLTYEIENRADKLPAAQLALEELVAQPDPPVSLAGKKRLAWFHKERTRNYEKAVALYLDISQPPGTLWDLQECYRRWGRKTEAYTVLTELASIFPAEAARAVWVQGQYREQDGEKEKAIALYRRLLSQPEWKKTWESSQAHQALERLGIATGGAVINEVR
jgi:tetratricopeptide (TPR) repeat protein